MTTLTVISVLLVVYGLLRPRHFGYVLAIAGATPAGAAFVAGDTAVPTFYFVALGACALLGAQLLDRSRQRRPLEHPQTPGVTPLVLLVIWAVVVTLSAPIIFDGMTVYASGGFPNELRAGSLTPSNTAQLLYLALSVAVVVLLARGHGAGPGIVGLAAGSSMVLSLWAWLGRFAGLPFPAGFFDNSPGFAYIDGFPGGAFRFRGIFSEPAALAVACLVTIAYMTARLPQTRGLRRVGVATVLAIAVFLGSSSTSTTFVIASVVLLALAGVVWVVEVVVARRAVSFNAISGASLLLGAVPFALPLVITFLTGEITRKVSGSSFEDRSGSDDASYQILLDTSGFGVGLGSNRPSSFSASLLSTVGVVGTLLFVVCVVVLTRRTWTLHPQRPALWALIAALVTKLISGPDLNDTSGLLWLCLGALAHAAAVRQHEDSYAPRRQREPWPPPDGSSP